MMTRSEVSNRNATIPTPTPMATFAPVDRPVVGTGVGLDELVGGTMIVVIKRVGVVDSDDEDDDTVVVEGVKLGLRSFNMSISVLCHRT